MMSSRDKFNALMSFEDNTPNIKLEYGYWAGLIKNWNKEGAPVFKGIETSQADIELIRMSASLTPELNEPGLDGRLMKYFELEPYPVKFPCNFSPMIEKKVLEKTGEYTIFVDEYGLTQKILGKGTSVPLTLDYPVKNIKDFDDYKAHYNKDYKSRLPKDFESLAKNLKNRDFAIRLGGHPFGFSGTARHIMGEFNYMLGLYDNPTLIKDINEFYLDFVMGYWGEILKNIEIDWIMIWEDMAFKTGSIISKDAFSEFMSPYYLRFIDFLKQCGVKNIIVDSDGLIDELVPLWVKLGVTGIFPMEAVSDALKIREEFPKLQMLGAVDKKILFNTNNKNMDDEFKKISLLMKKGGYIPHIDHSIPMDADFSKFRQYRERLNLLIDTL
jgi:hypothetical protein